MSKNAYKDLVAWQKAVQLASIIYKCTDNFPNKEQFGITNQMRRAVVSISSNIAEGYRRRTRKEYCHFVRIAYGSVSELETQVIIAGNIGYLPPDSKNQIAPIIDETSKLIKGLIDYLES
jgi:four helix bundle protein